MVITPNAIASRFVFLNHVSCTIMFGHNAAQVKDTISNDIGARSHGGQEGGKPTKKVLEEFCYLKQLLRSKGVLLYYFGSGHAYPG